MMIKETDLLNTMKLLWQSLNDANEELNKFIEGGMPKTTEQRLKSFIRRWNLMKERADILFDAIEQQAELSVKSVEIRLPFDDETFAKAWQEWKDYLAEQHNKRMKSRMEHAALAYLKRIADNKEDVAVSYLHFAMANGYPRFFIVESKDYKQPTQTTGGRGDGDF